VKLKLQFLIAAVIVLAVYIPCAHGQARLTFSGGGIQLSTTVQTPITYTITTDNCLGAGRGPFFVFDGTGTPFDSELSASGTITFSINGGNALPINRKGSGVDVEVVTADDLYIFGSLPGAVEGSTVVLSAGTITTANNVAATRPANGSYTTFITNSFGDRCSENGVSAAPSAASVSVSGRVLTSSKRGLSNAVVYLSDSQGNIRNARTNSLGYYRFQDIQAGQSVTITVVSKRFQFAPQVVNVNEEMSGLNFLAEQ
jgi:hypothetical protein